MPIQKELSQQIQLIKSQTTLLTKLQLSNCKITTIDRLQKSLAQNVKWIDLSQNFLTSLQGIQQFINLQQLNISENKIKKSQQLLPLRALKKLQKLYIKGNKFLNEPINQEFIQFVSCLNTDLPILKQTSNKNFKQSQFYQTSSNNSELNKKSLLKSNTTRKLQSNLSQQNIFQSNEQINQYQLSKRDKNRLQNIQIKDTMSKRRQQILKSNQFIEEKESSLEFSQEQIRKVSQQNNQLNIQQTKQIALKRNLSKNERSQFSNQINDTRKRQLSANLTPNRKYSQSKSKQQQFFLQTISNRSKSVRKSQRVSQNKLATLQKNNSPTIQKQKRSRIQKINQLTIQKRGEHPSGLKILSSSRKNIQMQVDNMVINIDSQDVNLNYGSIIQKQEDQSYQLEFDFIKRSRQQQYNPKRQLQYDEQQIKEKETKSNNLNYPKINIQTQKQKFQPLNQTKQKKGIKRNNQIKQIQGQMMINSYQSPTFLIPTPQFTNQSYDFAHKSNLSSQALIAENIQNSYYKHLVSVNPSLTLLYSSIPSLSNSQKNILLQILFKNHKQLFLQLTKQHFYKEQTRSNLNQKSFYLDSLSKTNQQQQNKLNQLKLSSQKQIRIIQLLTVQKKEILREKEQLKIALKTRQKIIQDLQIDFKLIKKNYHKMQSIYELSLKQDQKEQIIMKKRDDLLKKQYFKKVLQQYKYNEKINKMKVKMQRNVVKNCLKAFKNYQLINLYIKTKLKLKEQNLIREYFNCFKLNKILQKKERTLINWLNKLHQKQSISLILKFKLCNKIKKAKLNKANQFLQKRYFNCWKSNVQKRVNHLNQINQNIIKSTKMKLLKTYFYNLKQKAKQEKQLESKRQQKIIRTREKFSFNQFVNIMNLFEKKRQNKTFKLTSFIKHSNFTLLRALFHKKINFQKLKEEKSKKAKIHNLKRYFKMLKKGNSKCLLIKNNTKSLIQKVNQAIRIKDLVLEFKANYIVKSILLEKKKDMIYNLKNNMTKKKQKRIKMQLHDTLANKKFEVKWKWTIFNVLYKNMVLNKHNKILQKYQKQSQMNKITFEQTQILNEKTIQTLKGQVQLYSNQLIFHKTQIQKLSQREMIILSQKQQCLLQLRQRQAIIQQLNSRLSLQSMQRNEINKKYDKILDLYAETVDQYEHVKRKQYKNDQFLYDTINQGDITSRTLRKQNKRGISPVRDFCSLKNKYEKNN